ncbi:MAG: sigma 54-interacting transcriptional regulator [Bacteroidales bacterium]|nr:sigma 54-interacting transcriptional regulator [Bacteroidales bacterium]MCL2133144.1 sigma 54-interacting transcriptional regulator [Bacteroidales bacterium]
MDLSSLKQRFEVIGSTPELNRALDIARQVAPTDLSVLVTGESGVGKEVFPQIIHHFSSRKHGPYIAVNCGAIPDGTIDSELFGHEKGSFTGAHDARKGYFEVANGGTIFLDEVAELPLATQVRLLRVLESGEFIKVGSSKAQKTNVRVIAATNTNVLQAVQKGRFREDLYYRLNTVPINIPPLRERKEDIHLLFRKFALDFAERYQMPVISLTPEAQATLRNYYWPGNVRQLKNVTEQLSVIENERIITAEVLKNYLPNYNTSALPVLSHSKEQTISSEREILYNILFELRNDMNALKQVVHELSQDRNITQPTVNISQPVKVAHSLDSDITDTEEIKDSEDIKEENLSLEEHEKSLIKIALAKNDGNRKSAAEELGISTRTLYRKLNEYNID